MIRRVPMIVGPLVGGWLITRFGWDQGVHLALLGCIGLSAATAILQWFMAESPTEEAASLENSKRGISFRGVANSFNPALQSHPTARVKGA